MHIKGNLYIQAFKGATAIVMNTYIKPTLEDHSPDIALIHVDTNDVSSGKSVKDIASNIMNIGKQCKAAGVNNVMISSITKRKNFKFQKIINEVNAILADECAQQNFSFINNANIIYDDICDDRLHLNYRGTCKLANNFINAINLTYNT